MKLLRSGEETGREGEVEVKSEPEVMAVASPPPEGVRGGE